MKSKYLRRVLQITCVSILIHDWFGNVIKMVPKLSWNFWKLYCLIGQHSELNLCCKWLLYKQIICPIWSYGIQMWGVLLNPAEIKFRPNKTWSSVLLPMPHYVQNSEHHLSLQIQWVCAVIWESSVVHEKRKSSFNHIATLRRSSFCTPTMT